RRNMLEWQTASTAERDTGIGRMLEWRAMAPAALIAVGMALLAIVRATRTGARALSSPDVLAIGCLALLWPASPALARGLRSPPRQRLRRLTAAQSRTARALALLHSRYSGRFVNDDPHGLVPDNVQEVPGAAVAMRTSPVNTGRQLL